MSENTSPNEPRLHRAGGDERDMVTKCAKCCVLPFWLAGSQTLVTRDPEWEGYERMVYETKLEPTKFRSHIGIMIDYSDLVFKTSKNFSRHDFDMANSSEPVAIGFLSTALALRVELKR